MLPIEEENKVGFEIGQIGMWRKQPFKRENRLDNRWLRPYTITKSFEKWGFEIQSPEDNIHRYNTADLRPMEGSDSEDWLEDKEGWILSKTNKNPDSFKIRLKLR